MPTKGRYDPEISSIDIPWGLDRIYILDPYQTSALVTIFCKTSHPIPLRDIEVHYYLSTTTQTFPVSLW